MRKNLSLYRRIAPLLVVLLTISSASAAVVGTLNIANDIGGGVTLSSDSIDFLLPIGGGTGSIATGIGTNITYSGGGPLGSGTTGTILDIASSASVPVSDFMTFSGNPNLHFDLSALGPGVANTAAVNSFDPNSAPSSPSVGSPYILQATATGTTLTFSAVGIARDGTSPNSTWSGLFTTQFAGMTPFQIQQTLLASGSVSSTNSASFIVLAPEPAAGALLLACLLLLVRCRKFSTGC